ncbi:unnamed protein product, partial [Ectocarpus sp. 6 AP-2014]
TLSRCRLVISRKLDGNELECLPTSMLVEVDDDASAVADGLHVDLYGDECGEW